MEDEVVELFPPENYALVAPGVYRSSFPTRKTFPFLEKLALKTVMYSTTQDASLRAT